MVKNRTRYQGQCDYHWGDNNCEVSWVQLREGSNTWHDPILVCKKCLKHLKGLFRFIRVDYHA